ncbi:MAG: YfhO family protein [Candidatus Aureabacteria bacterium]|nr:YfhO family protein [Candidatus Auribacterota bacterium]
MSEFKKDIPCLLGFLALTVAFFSAVIFRSDPVVLSSHADMLDLFIPMRQYASSSLSRGILPFWNPYIFCGVPFLADTFSAIFYPVNLLFLAVPLHLAINYSVIAQTLLSGIFFYYYIRCFVRERSSAFTSALVYMFGATQVCHIFAGHLCYLSTMIWIPLLFLFVERYFQKGKGGYILAAGATLALQILASHLQVVFYGCLALFLYCIFRAVATPKEGKRPGQFMGKGIVFPSIIAVGISLAAVQLLPACEFLLYSMRGGASYEFCSIFSFPPENSVTFLMPDLMGDDVYVRYWGRCYLWEMCAYIGVFPLVAAMFGAIAGRDRRRAFFSVLAFASVILAFGKYTPVFRLFYDYVPGFSFFRGNSKFMLLTTFSLATLCAIGIDEMLRTGGDAGRRLARAATMLALTAAVGAVTALLLQGGGGAAWRAILNYSASFQRQFNPPPDLGDAVFVARSQALAVRSLLTFSGFCVAGALILFLLARGTLHRRIAKILILLLVVVDLFAFGLRYLVACPLPSAYWPEKVVDFLRADKDYYRILTTGGLLTNAGMACRVSNVAGYNPNYIAWYKDYIDFSQGREETNLDYLSFSRLLHLLNVKYIMLPRGYRPTGDLFTLKMDQQEMSVYLNNDSLPRAHLAHDVMVMHEKESILRELMSPFFDPLRSVILEDSSCPLLEDSAEPDKGEDARIVSYSPNYVALRTKALRSAYLIVADTYYPGWKALVDGKERKIYKANYIQRAVYLDPGEHTVEFVYFPLSFKVGLGISIAALIGVVVAALRIGRKRVIGRDRHYLK